jgi:hypothetical protein
MNRTLMTIPRTMGMNKVDSLPALTQLGFVLKDDTHPYVYELLAPDGYTMGRNGANYFVYDKQDAFVFAFVIMWELSNITYGSIIE